MVKVRVLRPTMIAGIERKANDVLVLNEQHVERLVALGLVAIVTATPAPKFYSDRMMRTHIT